MSDLVYDNIHDTSQYKFLKKIKIWDTSSETQNNVKIEEMQLILLSSP